MGRSVGYDLFHCTDSGLSYRQNELKEGAQRAVGKQYYYIDYAHFCNVVKWRIAKMRHKIDSTLRNVPKIPLPYHPGP